MNSRLTISPVEIHLKDLPLEGRDFTYTRSSGELNQALGDLIGKNELEVNFRITPMGNTFDLRGTVKTYLDLECALCAIDMKFNINQNLHELLVMQKPLTKGEQLAKTNHASEWENSGPDYILLDSDVFRVADYIHEVIALAEPIRPLGKPDCDISCENIAEPVKKWLKSDGSEPDPIKSNPFQVLEKIKLKS